jgi:hypothetical protein
MRYLCRANKDYDLGRRIGEMCKKYACRWLKEVEEDESKAVALPGQFRNRIKRENGTGLP